MDYLSRRYGVLFVVACGNIMAPGAPYPDHFLCANARVQPPADSLLALSVGSLAKHSDRATLARANEVSPFSCVGPGADGGRKPELVAHGGNLTATWEPTPRTGAYGVDESGRRLAYDVGTSFSAPIVSGFAAQLFDAYPGSSVNLVKALLLHFANPNVLTPSTVLSGGTMRGWGEPQLGLSLNGRPDAAVFVCEGRLTPDSYQHIRFHVPRVLAVKGTLARLAIRATVVYDPPVDADNQSEYSQSRIAVSLFKNTPDGLCEVALKAGGENHRLRWNPTISFYHPFSRGFAAGEWELRLRLYTRGKLLDGFSQSYAVVIEVLDAKGSVDVYRSVVDEYGSIYVPLRLKEAA